MFRSVQRSALAALLAGLMLPMFGGSAHAVVIYSDTFESTARSTLAQNAVPEVADYGSSGWYGVEFGSGAGVSGDATVTSESFFVPANDLRANMQRDSGFMLKLDTTGFSSVSLTLEWNTRGTDVTPDRFRIDYISSAAIDALVLANPHGFLDLTAYTASLTNLFSSRNDSNSQFPAGPFALPTDVASLYVVLWMDDGSGDIGQFDNIVVSGELKPQPVPEPSALLYFAVGLLGLSLAVRRRKPD
jgi:PEP-CTERM motif